MCRLYVLAAYFSSRGFSLDNEIRVKTFPVEVRLRLMVGRSLRGSVAWNDPIVMNTNEELRQAYEDLQNGTFIKG